MSCKNYRSSLNKKFAPFCSLWHHLRLLLHPKQYQWFFSPTIIIFKMKCSWFSLYSRIIPSISCNCGKSFHLFFSHTSPEFTLMTLWLTKQQLATPRKLKTTVMKDCFYKRSWSGRMFPSLLFVITNVNNVLPWSIISKIWRLIRSEFNQMSRHERIQ